VREGSCLDTERTISHTSVVDLLINQLKLAIRDLLERKGIRARVLDKTNAQGERVIGIIIARDQRSPPPRA
jgi:hypothetical protein